MQYKHRLDSKLLNGSSLLTLALSLQLSLQLVCFSPCLSQNREPLSPAARYCCEAQSAFLHGKASLAPALKKINMALAVEPHNPGFLNLKAVILGAQSDLEEALQVVDEGLKYLPNDSSLLLTKAGILLSLGRGEEALKSNQQAIDQKMRGAYMQRAKIYFSMKRYDQAEKATKQVLLEDPHNLVAKDMQIQIEMKGNRWNEVISSCNYLKDIYKTDQGKCATLLRERGWAYFKTKQYDLAMKDLSFVEKYWPDDRDIHEKLLALYTERKDAAGIAKEKKFVLDFDEDIQPVK